MLAWSQNGSGRDLARPFVGQEVEDSYLEKVRRKICRIRPDL